MTPIGSPGYWYVQLQPGLVVVVNIFEDDDGKPIAIIPGHAVNYSVAQLVEDNPDPANWQRLPEPSFK